MRRRRTQAPALGTGFAESWRRSSALFALFLAALAGCRDPLVDRWDRAQALAEDRFGDDDRLSADIDIGTIRRVDEVDDTTWTLDARASAPFPTLGIDNGTTSDVTVRVTLSNVSPGARYLGRLSSLADRGRKDPACGAAAFEDRADVRLGPVAPEAIDPTTVAIDLVLPACARTDVVSSPPTDADVFTLAIVGTIEGDPNYLRAAADAAIAADAEYLHFLGNVGFADDASAYQSFVDMLATVGVPYGVSIGARDARLAPDVFVTTFGPSDGLAAIGEVRMLTLDTASARLSTQQMSLIEAIPTSRPPGLVASHEALFGFGTVDGLRSEHQGARAIEALGGRGFEHAFAGGAPMPQHRTIGGIELHELGRGDQGNARRELALVHVRRPWPALEPCVTSADCSRVALCDLGFCRPACSADPECGVDERCTDGGECRVVCAADEDCPGPLPTCGPSGLCLLDPVVEVERVSF